MQNIFTINRIKMVLVLLFTYFSVKSVAPSLFVANSPEINKVFIAEIINKPKEIAALPGKFLSSLSNFKLFNFESPGAPELPVQQNKIASIKVDPAKFAKVKQVTPPTHVVFKEIFKGVSTGVNAETGEKYINVKAGTKYKVVGYIEINGKTYPKIKFIE